MDSTALPDGLIPIIKSTTRAAVTAMVAPGSTGPQRVEQLTGYSPGQISRWGGDAHKDLMPLCPTPPAGRAEAMARRSEDSAADEAQTRRDRDSARRGSAALLRALIRAHGRPRADVSGDDRPGEVRHAR